MQKARRHSLQSSDRLQANGFRVYFTPLFEVLFTFPSRYWFAIGLSEVFSLTGWSPQIQTGFHVSRLTQDTAKHQQGFVYGTLTLCGPLSSGFHFLIFSYVAVLQPRPCRNTDGLGYCAFARHYLRNHFCFLFLWVLRCFSSPRSLIFTDVAGLQPVGLPHSDTPGSKVICTYPGLFAAYHVLLRLREPRHPPSALLLLFSFCPPLSSPYGDRGGAWIVLSLACSFSRLHRCRLELLFPQSGLHRCCPIAFALYY